MEMTTGAFVYLVGPIAVHKQLRIEFARHLTKAKQRSSFVVLKFPSGDVSIDERHLPAIRHCSAEADLRRLFEGYCKAIERGDSALIPVSAAGKGPTPQSAKVKVTARWPDPERPNAIDTTIAKEHTITVATSQLVQVNSQLYAPRWLIRKTLHERLQFWPSSVPGGQWFGAQQLWVEVFAPVWALVDEEESQRAKKAVGDARQTALRAEAAAKRVAYERDRDQANQAARVKAAEREAQRMAGLESIENAHVVWSERRATSKRSEQWLEEREGCLVRFSGSRVYIVQPNGSQVVKTRNTVQINGEELSPDHAVHKYRERSDSA